MLKIQCTDHEKYLAEVKAYAATLGLSDQLAEQLDRLANFGKSTVCYLGPDLAPHSFGFGIYRVKPDGTETPWIHGGLIFQGPSQPGDGSVDMPTGIRCERYAVGEGSPMTSYLTASQAYFAMPDYEKRLAQGYGIGDLVSVGPAYTMDGYQYDGCEGTYVITRVSRDEYGPTYDLTRPGEGTPWFSACPPSRLQPVIAYCDRLDTLRVETLSKIGVTILPE